MGANPFDPLPSEVRKKKLTLQELQERTNRLTKACDEQRSQHHREWEEHKREHHERRMEQALEHEALDERFTPTAVRQQRDREDDARYARFTDFDQLLELTAHEEYLRARRAWDRRHKVEDVELNVKVEFDASQMDGRQIWALIVAGFMALCFITGIATSGPIGIVLAPVWVILWAVFTRLPILYSTTFSGGGNSRGASGNAV